MQDEAHGPWYYEQVRLGYNYRMTDIAAALGVSQFNRLDTFIDRRQQVAAAYDAAFASLPLTTPWRHPDVRSAYHLYIIRIDAAERDRAVFDELRAAEIGVNIHYIPVYKQPWYRALGFPADYCPAAEDYYAEAISLPIFPALTGQDQRRVIDAVTRAVLA
jgi:dTDP-4-amino-4,6-dideoxygalactose transaminase